MVEPVVWEPELDAEALLVWLRSELSAPNARYAEAPRRLAGGLETYTYGLRLVGLEAPQAGLVLRIFHPEEDPGRATFEATVQNAVAESGFPAPRALCVCTDPSAISGACLVMERLPGHPLDTRLLRFRRAGRLVAETQLRLHALDPEPLRTALEARGLALPGLAESLDALASRIERSGAEALREGVGWLQANRPEPPEQASIIHGDCNPANVLVERGRVTGLVDWAAHNTKAADPAVEFAGTKTMLELFRVPPIVRFVLRGFASSYVRRYAQSRSFEEDVVRYYSMLTCVSLLLFVHEWKRGMRGVPAEHRPKGPADWGRSENVLPFADHFRAHTGIRLEI